MPKERRVVHISIRFRPETVDALRTVAEEEHRSINGTVLEAVGHYLRSRQLERARQEMARVNEVERARRIMARRPKERRDGRDD